MHYGKVGDALNLDAMRMLSIILSLLRCYTFNGGHKEIKRRILIMAQQWFYEKTFEVRNETKRNGDGDRLTAMKE